MSTMQDRDAAITRDPGQTTGLPGQGYSTQHYGYGRPYFNRNPWTETRPSFLTSEFLFTILTVIGIAITASVAQDIDSRLATELIAGVVGAYVISRGIAKAGARSSAGDPRDDLHLGDGDRR
jgi:hypothetical protein